MTDYTTIRVSTDTLATAKESKAEDETWNEYLLRCHSEGQPEVDTEVIAEELAAEISDVHNRIDDLQTHIDTRFNRIETQ